MPGILYHLSFAELVYQKLKDKIPLNKSEFMSGNLIPDLSIESKQYTHYKKSASLEGFFVPQLELAKELNIPSDSIKFGIYCHLYLDYFFIEKFLIPEFIWDKNKEIVINPRNFKKWSFKDFFSPMGIYGSYTEINQLMVNDNHISLDTINMLPEILPKTGIPIYDNRRKKTWKTELNEYLAEKKDYTGDIFDYNRLWNFIEETANQFINEL